MTNENVLNGMACPKCGNEGPLSIHASSWFIVYDEGVDCHGDVEYGDDAPCRCPECGHQGRVEDFRKGDADSGAGKP